MSKNCIVLTLIDNYSNADEASKMLLHAYKKYCDISGLTTFSIEKYNEDFRIISDNETDDFALKISSDETDILVLREQGDDGIGFQIENGKDRCGKINTLIERGNIVYKNLTILAHFECDKSTYATLKKANIITYRTGADYGDNFGWPIVKYIIDDCLLKGKLPNLDEIFKGAAKITLRPIMYELECLTAALKLSDQNDSDIINKIREIINGKIDKDILDKIKISDALMKKYEKVSSNTEESYYIELLEVFLQCLNNELFFGSECK